MKRDGLGKIEYDEIGQVEKFYPNDIVKSALFWTCQRIKIKSDVKRENAKAIIAFRYLRGPHKIIDVDTTYEADNVEKYPGDVKDALLKIDIMSNCFGYVFFDGLFWVDPLLDCLIYKIPVIENILESDDYKEINSPEENSIALFSKDNKFWHVSKTEDGKTWYGKNGIKKPAIENLKDNIEQFGKVKFYKRIII